LPRGRHGIPKELVVANQRERLLEAVAALIAEQGYAAMAVADVVERAGVSRGTFYKLFENKLDCVLTAQQEAYDRFHEAVVSACASSQEWVRGVSAGVAAALAFAAEHPADARLILASSHALSEPQLAREGIVVHERIIELLRESSKGRPGMRTPSALTERAAVGGAMSIVATFLAAQETDKLSQLRPVLVQIVVMPYLGDGQARRVDVSEG
jgi:AcrR family transcriptional regulator